MRALALPFVLLTAACSLTPLEEDKLQPAKNTCSDDSDCPGGTCDSSLGVCASTQGSFPNILLEVTPPTTVSGYGGIGFLKTANDLPLAGGALDVNIDVVAKVTGSVKPTQGTYSNCVLGYGENQDRNTAPVKITFTPTARLLGLSAPEYVTTSVWDSTTETYMFTTWMPADSYDIYVEPDIESPDYQPTVPTGAPESCKVAPQFIFNPEGAQVEVPAGDLDLPLVLQAPSQLSVTVPSPVNLEGWTVEIVHPGNGKLLSAPVTLKSDSANVGKYFADVEYTKLTDASQAGKELVRIRPTPCSEDAPLDSDDCDQIGPTLVVERAAVELFKEGEALVDQLAKLAAEPSAQDFPWVTLNEVTLFGGPSEYQGAATVRFVSSNLELKDDNGTQLAGVQAFFERTVEATDGKLEPIDLLPGEYMVYVAPTAAFVDYATTTAQLIVAAAPDHQSGKTITLEHIAHASGSVLTPAQEPAIGATVQAVASPSLININEIAAGTKAFQPQALSGSVDESGGFVLKADPGTLDFSVRPAEGTAFPWLVRPNVEVQSGAHPLGEMQIGWPIIYKGAVTPAPVGSGALIRVYVYMNQDGYAASRDGATSVVQIAETRADANGAFRLFLPPHLN